MNRDELEDRIADFTQWTYKFEFENGATTPLFDGGMINRQKQRRRYFFDALVAALGGSLAGRRVLDLGCGSGFWSLAALAAGAEFVLGLDSESSCIAQANLVFEASGIDASRYRFEQADVFAHELSERFDVVLCLALMHHVARPVELFARMSGVGAEMIVIETELARSTSSMFAVSSLPARKAAAHRVVLIPSRGALVDLAADYGYSALALERNMTDYTGMKDYRSQRRLAFLCTKDGNLQGLAAEPPPTPWWLGPLDPRRALQRFRG